MPDRISRVERKTKETEISATVRLDGSGETTADTGIGFFDHMLGELGRHSQIDLIIKAKGDTKVDDHHTVEDVGILIGQALKQALGDKRSIRRFGSAAVPMDDALTRVHLDISGRGGFYLHGEFPREKTGTFDSYLAEDFFRSLTQHSGVTMHMELLYGTNPHHVVESAFKSVAAALHEAASIDSRIVGVPSTKGII